MKILAYRTTMPFQNRGPGGPALSPPTQKSIIPTNNVPTIQDVLDGTVKTEDVYPHTRGNWAPGKDVDKSYKDKGEDYKRKDRDLSILRKLFDAKEKITEQWKVKVNGGAITFGSLPLAQKYMRDHGIPFNYLTRTNAQKKPPLQKERVEVIAESINSCVMVESIDIKAGVMESGSAFCVSSKHFLTCAHVIKKYNKNKSQNLFDFYNATVNIIHNGRRISAKVKAVNTQWDIALIVADLDVEPFEIDTSVSVGEDIIAVGSPHGYENNVSTGTVGSLDREIYSYPGAPEYMFVDLSVFPGNSGGPIIKESNGAVIGLVTLIIATAGESGLNAALPPQYIENFLKETLESN